MDAHAQLSDTAHRLLESARVDAEKLESSAFHTKYLAKAGELNKLTKLLATLPAEERKAAGAVLNATKQTLLELARSISTTDEQSDTIDLSLPPYPTRIGRLHPISTTITRIAHIFEQIGFTRVRYPELDFEFFPFDSLNMPKDHPARDEWETFWIDDSAEFAKPHERLGRRVLTPHTSNGQVHEMLRLNSTPPIRMMNITRTYRRQADVTHTEMFHQFEGLVIDKGITIQHLKGVIEHFAHEFYGPDATSRIRPFHFQFTEPSFEVDFSCTLCGGTGKDDREESGNCRFCKGGWHEVGGAGMVHPEVLKAGEIDPEVYTGFAFGWGVERTFTLQKGLKVDDIRLFYNNDPRFLEQFS